MASINQACNNITPAQNGQELSIVLASILADITALNAAQTAMAAKLNADAGVTDVNYSAPAALKTTA